MKRLLIISMLLIPTNIQAAPSNLQLYNMQQRQNQLQMLDDMDRNAKMNSMKQDIEELQSRQKSQSMDTNSDLLLLLILKKHPELLKELQK